MISPLQERYAAQIISVQCKVNTAMVCFLAYSPVRKSRCSPHGVQGVLTLPTPLFTCQYVNQIILWITSMPRVHLWSDTNSASCITRRAHSSKNTESISIWEAETPVLHHRSCRFSYIYFMVWNDAFVKYNRLILASFSTFHHADDQIIVFVVSSSICDYMQILLCWNIW